jgi:non-canonical (house-cleaning) NTP pyrophosphatase
MNNIYVMPYKGVWAVKKEAEEEPESVHETREGAINTARKQAEDENHVIILLADGTIDNPEAYSIEPLIDEKDKDNKKH